MSDRDPLRKYVEAGIALTQLTRARAEAIVKELVKAGEVQREQAQDRVEELLDRSRKGKDGLAAMIRKELGQQLSSMGFATKEDLARLEARLEGRLAATTEEAPTGTPTAAGRAGTSAGTAKRGSPPAATAKAATAASTGTAKAATETKAAKATRAAKVPKATKATPPPGTAARRARGTTSPGRRPDAPADEA